MTMYDQAFELEEIEYILPDIQTDKITPECFVKNNLPDYEKKFIEHIHSNQSLYEDVEYDTDFPVTKEEWEAFQANKLEIEKYRFCVMYFSDALTAYTVQICKRQREMCYEVSSDDYEVILTAPMPELNFKPE